MGAVWFVALTFFTEAGLAGGFDGYGGCGGFDGRERAIFMFLGTVGSVIG